MERETYQLLPLEVIIVPQWKRQVYSMTVMTTVYNKNVTDIYQ